ncbi:hypothetical protein GW17_00043215 [Ensete ventricosum]|nr:hypothetical protein GW17_00043215 [Ensete ventricosum]
MDLCSQSLRGGGAANLSLGSPALMLRRLPMKICRGRCCCRGALGVAIVDLKEIGAFITFGWFIPLAVVADPLRPVRWQSSHQSDFSDSIAGVDRCFADP